MHTTFTTTLTLSADAEKERLYDRSLEKYRPVLDTFRDSLSFRESSGRLGGDTPVDDFTIVFRKASVKLVLSKTAERLRNTCTASVRIPDMSGVVRAQDVFRALEWNREPWAFIVYALDEAESMGFTLHKLRKMAQFKRAYDHSVAEIVGAIRVAYEVRTTGLLDIVTPPKQK